MRGYPASPMERVEVIHADVSTGILGKSSSATYRLRIRFENLDLLPDALGAITGAKNAHGSWASIA